MSKIAAELDQTVHQFLSRPDRYAGMVLIGGGCLYLASAMVQFGPLFHGPAGISIPVGVPMLMVVRYAITRDLLDR